MAIFSKIDNVQVINNLKTNKIVILQSYGTPGISKMFNVKPNKNYVINMIGLKNKNTNIFLSINDKNGKIIFRRKIKNNKIKYQNKKYKKIKVCIIFKNAKINQYLFLKNINLKIERKKINVKVTANKEANIKETDIKEVRQLGGDHLIYKRKKCTTVKK